MNKNTRDGLVIILIKLALIAAGVIYIWRAS